MTSLSDLLGLRIPLVQAPMAGTATPALAAAVSNAGALGSVGLGSSSAATANGMINQIRALTDKPFNVNLFCHRPPVADPLREAAWLAYLGPSFRRFGVEPPTSIGPTTMSFVEDDAMLEMLLATRPPIVSFHFGLPSSDRIAALRNAGMRLIANATNLGEACQIEAAGLDAIVAQGIEAGGHRGAFDLSAVDEGLGVFALTRLFARELNLPVIAAGGIMDGAGIAAVLALGANAAQMGTAFVACPESAADDAYRSAILSRPAKRTAFSAAISGRRARAISNDLIALGEAPGAPLLPDYPIPYAAAKALDTAAKNMGDSAFAAQWAGQAVNLSRAMPAADLVAVLRSEMAEAVALLAKM